MKKRKTWRNNITKRELRHLNHIFNRDGTRLTLNALKEMFEGQAQIRRKENGLFEPCFMCKKIAHKLGFAV